MFQILQSDYLGRRAFCKPIKSRFCVSKSRPPDLRHDRSHSAAAGGRHRDLRIFEKVFFVLFCFAFILRGAPGRVNASDNERVLMFRHSIQDLQK